MSLYHDAIAPAHWPQPVLQVGRVGAEHALTTALLVLSLQTCMGCGGQRLCLAWSGLGSKGCNAFPTQLHNRFSRYCRPPSPLPCTVMHNGESLALGVFSDFLCFSLPLIECFNPLPCARLSAVWPLPNQESFPVVNCRSCNKQHIHFSIYLLFEFQSAMPPIITQFLYLEIISTSWISNCTVIISAQ